MAKRFTDTEIWDKEWFMNLSPTMKCLVQYVRDRCNLAGIWSPNWALASTHIGEKVSAKDLLAIDGGRQFFETDDRKIFCDGFIRFQYGEVLNPKSPVHKKIIEILKKHKSKNHTLYDTLSNRVLNTPKDMEEEKEKEKEEEKEGLREEQILFAKEILKAFQFTETANMDKLRMICAFLQVQSNQGGYEYFRQQFVSYMRYKNLSGEQKHNFSSFFGKQAERFEDGKWNDANWEQKLIEYTTKNLNNGTANNSYPAKQGVSEKRASVELLAARSEEFLQQLGT